MVTIERRGAIDGRPAAERIPASRAFFAALRLRKDPKALDDSPLTQLRAVRERAAAIYRREPHAAGLALRDLLDQAIAAEDMSDFPELSTRSDARMVVEVLAAGGSLAEAMRRLGIPPTSARARRLHALRDHFFHRFLQRAQVAHPTPRDTPQWTMAAPSAPRGHHSQPHSSSQT